MSQLLLKAQTARGELPGNSKAHNALSVKMSTASGHISQAHLSKVFSLAAESACSYHLMHAHGACRIICTKTNANGDEHISCRAGGHIAI